MYEVLSYADKQLYAMKKTVLRISNSNVTHVQEKLTEMMREAKFISEISNPHIISFKQSWVEITYEQSVPHQHQKLPPKIDCFPEPDLISPNIEFAASGESSSEDEDDETVDTFISKSTTKKPIEKAIEKITLYIQMELCTGTLEHFLEKNVGVLTPDAFDKRLHIAHQIVQALNALHSEYNIIHRDVTPNNIFFSRDGTVKLGDFGLSTKCKHLIPVSPSPFISVLHNGDSIPTLSLSDTQDQIDTYEVSSPTFEQKGENIFIKETNEKEESKLTNGIGTKAFASPEQLNKCDYDHKTDIYPLGLIFQDLFAPTVTQSERIEQLTKCKEMILPDTLLRDYPEMASLIKKMISFNPKERPQAKEILKHHIFASLSRSTSKLP